MNEALTLPPALATSQPAVSAPGFCAPQVAVEPTAAPASSGDSSWDAPYLQGDDAPVDFGRPIIDKQVKICTIVGLKADPDPTTESESLTIKLRLEETATDTTGKEIFAGREFQDRMTVKPGTLEKGEMRARIGWETLGKLANAAGTLQTSSAGKAQIHAAVKATIGRRVKVQFKAGESNGNPVQNMRYLPAGK